MFQGTRGAPSPRGVWKSLLCDWESPQWPCDGLLRGQDRGQRTRWISCRLVLPNGSLYQSLSDFNKPAGPVLLFLVGLQGNPGATPGAAGSLQGCLWVWTWPPVPEACAHLVPWTPQKGQPVFRGSQLHQFWPDAPQMPQSFPPHLICAASGSPIRVPGRTLWSGTAHGTLERGGRRRVSQSLLAGHLQGPGCPGTQSR